MHETSINNGGTSKAATNLANVNLQGFSSKVESMYFGLEDGRQANKFLASCQPVRPLVEDGRRRPETGIRLFEYAKWPDVDLELLLFSRRMFKASLSALHLVKKGFEMAAQKCFGFPSRRISFQTF